jgi:hypothetical protein
MFYLHLSFTVSNDRKWNVARVSPITTSGEEAARNCVFFSSSGTKHQTFIFIFIISIVEDRIVVKYCAGLSGVWSYMGV